MLTPDGNLPHIRSKTTGLSFDTGEVPGGEYFLIGTNGFVDVAPDLAERGTLLALREARPQDRRPARARSVDGVLDLDTGRRSPGAQHTHRHRRARVDAPHGRGPHDRRRVELAQAALRGMARYVRHGAALAGTPAARWRPDHRDPPPAPLGHAARRRPTCCCAGTSRRRDRSWSRRRGRRSWSPRRGRATGTASTCGWWSKGPPGRARLHGP